ncbi:ATP-binding protein [Spongiactinospora sp. TRM90649]|uniref:ATP-binding protein n=1 Tax=Spongiactinospora sp. TRM90649 TaxID=3031114 RepID=UPI0023F7E247|nr:ATP-binding protein [Spongiactinospora sp. TRM90649]MDF5756126.1 ATP-binding protein [Spongiactinospora sp. TRM90649]
MPEFLGAVHLPTATSSVPVSRAFVHALLNVHGYANDECSVVLVISELVTNAVVHGSTRPGERLRLIVTKITDGVRLAVIDPGRGGGMPHVRHVSAESTGGRGLDLVQHLAVAWGVDECTWGRIVWADLAVRAA